MANDKVRLQKFKQTTFSGIKVLNYPNFPGVDLKQFGTLRRSQQVVPVSEPCQNDVNKSL